MLNVQNCKRKNGWGSWTRTRTDGVRVRCSTIKLIPSRISELKTTLFGSEGSFNHFALTRQASSLICAQIRGENNNHRIFLLLGRYIALSACSVNVKRNVDLPAPDGPLIATVWPLPYPDDHTIKRNVLLTLHPQVPQTDDESK